MANTRKARITQQGQQKLPGGVPPSTASWCHGSRTHVVHADVQGFLADCMSLDRWEKYTAEEKEAIIASLPATRQAQIRPNLKKAGNTEVMQETTPDPDLSTNSPHGQNTYSAPPLSSDFCSKDLYLRRHVARFKRDLDDGYYEKAWQNKAIKAHEERMTGKFDQYLEEHAEQMFTQEDQQDHGTDNLAQADSEDGDYLDGARKRRKNGNSGG